MKCVQKIIRLFRKPKPVERIAYNYMECGGESTTAKTPRVGGTRDEKGSVGHV